MAITAMGLGTKGAPANTNLDPQAQFWSWLYVFQEPSASNSVKWAGGYIKGFPITQTDPAGMSVQIGVRASGGADCAVFEYAKRKMTVLSTDGTPQVVTIPTAPTSGSRIDSIVSYIDTTSADPETETPGTPEYVKTVVVSGTASSSPTAPNKQQIQAALPPTVENWYHWADVRVGTNQTTITNSNITDRKPDAPELYWTTSSIWSAIQSQVKSAAESAAKRLAPDWKKAVNITSNSYTPSQNGFIYVACILDTNQYNSTAEVTAGDTYIYHMQNARNDLTLYNTQHCATMPVAKGVPIKFILQNGATWQARRFCPYMLTN